MRIEKKSRPVSLCLLMMIAAAGQAPAQNSLPQQSKSVSPLLRNDRPVSVQTTPDPICELLMKQYVLVGGKISTDDVEAAIQLVGSRGRAHGYWKVVLDAFKKSYRDKSGNVAVRKNTLAVLNRMLTYEGWARWNHIRSVGPVASPIGFYLGPEVLEQIIAHSAKANSHEIDAFVLAVRQAFDPRGKLFLQNILHSSNVGGSWQDARFHAAVALAELGEAEGIEWLIDHTDADAGESYVFRVPHRNVPGGARSQCCQAALVDLSGQTSLTTRAQWRQWWDSSRSRFQPAMLVNLNTP